MRFQEDFYEAALPGPDRVLLIVEVSLSSLGYDRNTRLPLYARVGIPEVWLVDLDERRLEVYVESRDGFYRHIQHLELHEGVEPTAIPNALEVVF